MVKKVKVCPSFKEAARLAKQNAINYRATFWIRRISSKWIVEGEAQDGGDSCAEPWESNEDVLIHFEDQDYLWHLESGPDPRWSADETIGSGDEYGNGFSFE